MIEIKLLFYHCFHYDFIRPILLLLAHFIIELCSYFHYYFHYLNNLITLITLSIMIEIKLYDWIIEFYLDLIHFQRFDVFFLWFYSIHLSLIDI